MKNIFGSIKSHAPGKNTFDLSHEKKMSIQMGALIPILNQEILPGDSIKCNSEIFMRLAPMIAPMMHRVNVYTHFFFVPNRIIWDEWEDFITGGPDGDLAPVHPYVQMNAANEWYFKPGKLADYMGLPSYGSTPAQSINVSALPFRAYYEIFNEYYRDQNLDEGVDFSKGSGLADPIILNIQNRCWEKDYFTSCLPWSQRGGEVGIPVDFQYSTNSQLYNSDGTPGNDGQLTSSAGGKLTVHGTVGRVENLADNSVNVPITDLRKSVRLQEYLELMARGGSRYIEQLKSIFGVNSSDARLQRPEYLGGGKQPVVISETLQTSATNTQDTAVDASIQGTMAGHGISVGKSNSFKKRFEEHGHVIGIMSVLPRTAYQQGINRSWTRFDKFDHYIPQFAHIGEQEVLNQEIYADLDDDAQVNTGTFGYQSRYAEYKYKESTVHGDFRDTLDYWHMGRKFSAPPVLNKDFVSSDPTQRVFAVTDPDEHKLYVQVYNRLKAIRPMPYHNDPRL